MRKTDAIKLFGSVLALAEAYECTTQAVYQWPDELPRKIADRVVGAAVRKGLYPHTDDGLPPVRRGAAA